MYDHYNIDFYNIPKLHSGWRHESDSIKELWRRRRTPGVVKAIHGFPELNLHHSCKDMYKIRTSILKRQGGVEPYILNIEQEEEVKVLCEDVFFHDIYEDWPVNVVWTRFVPGKPNRAKM